MDDWLVTLLVALVASSPGVVSIVMQSRKNKAEVKKTDAEAVKADAEAIESMSQAALALLTPLRARVQELEALDMEKTARLDVLTSYVEYLENGIHTLIGQLSTNGYRAVWHPMPLAEYRMQRVTLASEKQ